jgi:hypothetical protein
MKIRDLKRGLMIVLIILFSFVLISCGTGDGDGGGDDGGGGDIPPGGGTGVGNSISLGTTKAAVQSNNIDSAVITATVLDNYGAVVDDVLVTFGASAGVISASSQITDVNGEASITFKSGTADKSNQTATITASASGVTPASIPIQIVGSTLTLTVTNNKTSIPDDGTEEAILTITATDAAGIPVYNVPISLTTSGTGAVALSEISGLTDVSGVFQVTITGVSDGVVTVTAQGLGDMKSVDFTVNESGTVVFGIDSLKEEGVDVDFADPYALSTGKTLTIIVAAPDLAYSNVIFATTVGTWDGGAETVVPKLIAGGFAQAELSSADAGFATIEVYYEGSQLPRDSMTVAISQPSSEADSIVIQASATVVQPSSGSDTNLDSVTLTATVKSVTGQPVGGAPVAFSIENAVGGGERVSPVVVITDSSGVAESVFQSGTLSTDINGVTVKASVVGADPPIEDTIPIIIGGTAGSIAIGYSTIIESDESETEYFLPMAVLVADANGNPVSGATVTLGLRPIGYWTGAWYFTMVGDKEIWRVYYSGYFPNEDIDMNLTLDPVEDTNADGQLTPPNSAGGDVPPTVTTDENGVANFELTFLKTHAVWVADRVRASTEVFGTETSSYIDFTLPCEKIEGEGHLLGDSPWPYVLANNVSHLFPAMFDPETDIYSSLVGLPDGVIGADNSYTYTGLPMVGNTASDTITINGGWTVSFPVRIVFVP